MELFDFLVVWLFFHLWREMGFSMQLGKVWGFSPYRSVKKMLIAFVFPFWWELGGKGCGL